MKSDVLNATAEFEVEQTVKKSRRSVARILEEDLWHQGIVPYEIEGIFNGSECKMIKQAMREWEKSTCLKFVPKIENQHKKYLVFTKSDVGCYTSFGNEHRKSSIGMNCKCMKFGTILHELGHAIGLYHEHVRPDRDHYIEIHYHRVLTSRRHNFYEIPRDEVKIFGEYDFDSIMHYPENAFSIQNNETVIEPKVKINGKTPIIGQRSYLSKNDIAGINYLYKCPRCGGTLSEAQGIFSPPSKLNGSEVGFEYCQWIIRAAQGERIKLVIALLDIRKTSNCSTDYLEIRNGYQTNSTVLGHYCGDVESATIITNNFVTVKFARSQFENHRPGFILEYKAVCGGDIYLESDDTYYLESPNYPESYEPNKLCHWNIRAPYKHYIVIEFSYFELEESTGCKNDFLEVREAGSEGAPIIGSYCGKKDRLDIAAIMDRIVLTFVTNEMKEAGGFSAAISAISQYQYQ
ncbi:bone morphogenetic protein 1-like [Microplitis mediator]|uniref:bone morphogenetic protein 1-like n=1 Tax=Microplitis mediator TaxID=375433 RepID=UPI0025544B15|nr:bone morphogenetic protein 1-like [Microplitis mediator]